MSLIKLDYAQARRYKYLLIRYKEMTGQSPNSSIRCECFFTVTQNRKDPW